MNTYIALESTRYEDTFLLYRDNGGGLVFIGYWFPPPNIKPNLDWYVQVGNNTIIIFYCLLRKE